MKQILREHYGITGATVTEVQGGFAAQAFRVDLPDQTFFLKRYDKARPITEKYTPLIDLYCPIVQFLSESTLTNCLPQLCLTVEGNNVCEDSNYKYLLYQHIEGYTIADNDLTESQVAELGRIVGKLHGANYPKEQIASALYDKFEVDFNDKLSAFIDSDLTDYSFLKPYLTALKTLTSQVATLSKQAKQCDAPFVLCHTDIHKWNLMQTADHLILIDWEGLKYAPKEADFFTLEDIPYHDTFVREYERTGTRYQVNQTILDFYHLRRKSEDVWEYLEQLLYENLTPEQRAEVIDELTEECEVIPQVISEVV